MCDVDVEAFVETVFRNLDSPDPVMRMFAIHGKKYIDSLLTPSLFEQMRTVVDTGESVTVKWRNYDAT